MNWTEKQQGFKKPTKTGPQIFARATSASGIFISLRAHVHPDSGLILFELGWVSRVSQEELEEIATQAAKMKANLEAHLALRATLTASQAGLFSA